MEQLLSVASGGVLALDGVSRRSARRIALAAIGGGLLNMLQIAAAHAKSLTLTMGQNRVHRYLPRRMESIEKGQIDP